MLLMTYLVHTESNTIAGKCAGRIEDKEFMSQIAESQLIWDLENDLLHKLYESKSNFHLEHRVQ